MLRGVVIGGLIERLGEIGKNEESVGEAFGNPHLTLVISREVLPTHLPKVGELRRRSTATSKTSPSDHPHEFSLGLVDLVVEAAEDVAGRAGVVVLDEGAGAVCHVTEFVFAEGLHEEAAGVGMDRGFEDEDVGDAGGDDNHSRPGLPSTRSSY